MATVKDIGWGKYRQYEGPFYKGKHKYVLPAAPTEDQKILAVITATEGGCFDAWNGYDVCGWTSGLIQWCERGQYSVSDMLGYCAEHGPLITPVLELCEEYGLEFKPNKKGRWRFFFQGAKGEVDTAEEQSQLFYRGGDGTIGSWTPAAMSYAKRWAAAISSVWEKEGAQILQTIYTVERVHKFVMTDAQLVLAKRPPTDEAKAFYAAYLSFAANNPLRASKSLMLVANSKIPPWTQDWYYAALKELTFGPKVAIYPHRYDAIRPVLEKCYGVDLPDFSKELQQWTFSTGIPVGFDTRTLQRALLALGYDLGPHRDDGVYGAKTKAAVLTLEQLSGMVPEAHQDGMVDVYTYPAVRAALQAKSIDPARFGL